MKKVNPHAIKAIIDIVLITLSIIAIALCFSGCRTVQKSLTLEKKSIDSATVVKKEEEHKAIDWSELLKVGDVDVKITFDTSTVFVGTSSTDKSYNPDTTPHNSIATDFISHLVDIAHKPISSIEISAKNISDSVHNNVQSSAIKTTDSTHVKETVKNKDEKKESKSNTVLLIIAGISLIAIVYGAYVKSTADKAVKTPEEIYNTIKAQEINKIIK